MPLIANIVASGLAYAGGKMPWPLFDIFVPSGGLIVRSWLAKASAGVGRGGEMH